MKRKILGIFLITGLLFAGCVKDDIDDLQKQIDDLEGQVAKNTEAIQKDLLNQIASLEAELDALSDKTDQDNQNLTAMIADLQADLDTISNDVENNAKTVYYGNLVTDDEYAAYEAAGATVVTGKVVISKAEHAGIVKNLRWVGQDLITSVGTLEGIQNVGGDVIVTSTDTVIDLAGMVSIGGDFMIPSNPDLQSVTADDLLVLAGDLGLDEGAYKLQSISMGNLQVVGSLHFHNPSNMVGGATAAALTVINLNDAYVAGDLEMSFVVDKNSNAGTKFSIGQVDGEITIDNCGFETFSLMGNTIRGNFSLTNNNIITFNAKSVISIAGDVMVADNFSSSSGGPVKGTVTGLETLAFDALATIGGDLTIDDNRLLGDVFNTVTRVDGDITYYVKNKDLDVILLEELTTADRNIFLSGQINSLTGFNKVTTISDYRVISLGAETSPNNYLITGGDLILFNALENANISVKVSTYFNSNTGLAQSFTALKHVKDINVYLFYRYATIPTGAFPALETVENFKLYGDKMRALSADFSGTFESLDSITGTFTINNEWEEITGLGVKSLDRLSAYKKIQHLSMEELTSVTGKYGITLYVYDGKYVVDMPKLDSLAKLTVQTKVAGGDIAINMPLLSSVYEVNVNFSYYAPTSIDMQLPKLTELHKLSVSFKKGKLDASNLLTGLSTLLENEKNSAYDVKMYYVTGQTFCGMKGFLGNLVDNKQLDRVTLYKDNKTVPADQEETEIALLTSGC